MIVFWVEYHEHKRASVRMTSDDHVDDEGERVILEILRGDWEEDWPVGGPMFALDIEIPYVRWPPPTSPDYFWLYEFQRVWVEAAGGVWERNWPGSSALVPIELADSEHEGR